MSADRGEETSASEARSRGQRRDDEHVSADRGEETSASEARSRGQRRDDEHVSADRGEETSASEARSRGQRRDHEHVTSRGFGRVLVAVYALFALAATGRSVLQLTTEFHKAPVAYLLSALAAVIYLVATVALARGDRTSVRIARITIGIELVGVLTVGLWSYLQPSAFPDKTVWSHFGQGYGYVPLVLPMVGLWWLSRTGGEEPSAAAS